MHFVVTLVKKIKRLGRLLSHKQSSFSFTLRNMTECKTQNKHAFKTLLI